ncbi:MAG: hypothetical protein PHE88_03555 [Elusimicrobia bacterium]|nr:hypothetical protein [Elusimicrobiota bacterium]
MKKFGVLFLCFVGIVLFVFSANAEETGKQPKKSCVKNVPDSIIKSFETAYPNAVIKEGEMRTKGTTTYYEIEGKEGSQKKEVTYNSDGTVFKIMESIDVNSLPVPVKAVLAKNYSKYKIKRAEKITRDNTTNYKVCLRGCFFISKKIIMDESGNIIKKDKEK